MNKKIRLKKQNNKNRTLNKGELLIALTANKAETVLKS